MLGLIRRLLGTDIGMANESPPALTEATRDTGLLVDPHLLEESLVSFFKVGDDLITRHRSHALVGMAHCLVLTFHCGFKPHVWGSS